MRRSPIWHMDMRHSKRLDLERTNHLFQVADTAFFSDLNATLIRSRARH
jgi:hypothetical protein